jgi:hypothetical protein
MKLATHLGFTFRGKTPRYPLGRRYVDLTAILNAAYLQFINLQAFIKTFHTMYLPDLRNKMFLMFMAVMMIMKMMTKSLMN